MNYIIDSNIFLRYAVPENLKMFNECKKFLTLVENGTLTAYTTDLIIAEVQWVMARSYKMPKAKAVQLISTIVNQPNIYIIPKTPWDSALDIYSKYSIKFIDATIAAITYEQGLKNWSVVSYDEDFDKLGVKRLEPKDVLR